MPDHFPYDVFLNHSAKDKAVVRPLAERLRADGNTSKDETALHPSSFIIHPFPTVLCMSAHAFGSDWAQLESGTFGRSNLPFRDPLNKERRFLARLHTNRYSFDEAQTAARKANAAGN